MSLYAIIIETLASSIRCNDNIRGIHIPNTHKNTKLFQHADDCSISMPLILSLHLILDASVSIIRAYSDILRGHPCLIDLVIGTMFVSKPFT
jgi:hypothetical protein